MKDIQQMQVRINRFRYGKTPKKDSRKIKRLLRVIEWLSTTSIIGDLHRGVIKASKAQKFEAGGFHSFTGGGMNLTNVEDGEPIISRRDIAFIAPYHTNKNLKQCQTQYN